MLKEALRNITNTMFYGFATWMWNTAGFIFNNRYKFLGAIFLALNLLFWLLPSSEAKIIAILAFTVIGLGLIFRKEN